MLKGYWVGLVDVPDAEAYKPYLEANRGPIGSFGGRYIIRGGTREVVEGSARDKLVVIEFESYDKAIEGYDGPQPSIA
jgi:uncharacterized protein (DUF1330 family)